MPATLDSGKARVPRWIDHFDPERRRVKAGFEVEPALEHGKRNVQRPARFNNVDLIAVVFW